MIFFTRQKLVHYLFGVFREPWKIENWKVQCNFYRKNCPKTMGRISFNFKWAARSPQSLVFMEKGLYKITFIIIQIQINKKKICPSVRPPVRLLFLGLKFSPKLKCSFWSSDFFNEKSNGDVVFQIIKPKKWFTSFLVPWK
jgi:hypothetical protein